MRYFSIDQREFDLPLLERALKRVDRRYSIPNVQWPPRECGDLMYGEEIYGQIEISRPGQDLFEGELEEFKEFLEETTGPGKKIVLQILNDAKLIIAIQVLHQGRDSEQTLRKIDPVWEWLFANRKGLMQADGEGFYDRSTLILQLE